jgi:hypothetical protein
VSRTSVYAGKYIEAARAPGPLSDGKLLPWIKIQRAILAQGPVLYEVLCDVADSKDVEGAGFVRYCLRRGWLK